MVNSTEEKLLGIKFDGKLFSSQKLDALHEPFQTECLYENLCCIQLLIIFDVSQQKSKSSYQKHT